MCGKQVASGLTLRKFFDFRNREEEICDECKGGVVKLVGSSANCNFCLASLLDIEKDDQICLQCKRRKALFVHHPIFIYTEKLKDFFERYKFLGDAKLARVFRDALRERFGEFDDFVVVPVPSDYNRLRQRRFSPVELLLQEAGVRYVNCLQKLNSSAKQSDKSLDERWKNDGEYAFSQDYIDDIKDKKVVIFDDVMTTGSTIDKCAQTMIGYVKEMVSISLAR
jgi:competence protein ComFC